MYELGTVAIVRYCRAKNAAPKLGFLSPHIKQDYEVIIVINCFYQSCRYMNLLLWFLPWFFLLFYICWMRYKIVENWFQLHCRTRHKVIGSTKCVIFKFAGVGESIFCNLNFSIFSTNCKWLGFPCTLSMLTYLPVLILPFPKLINHHSVSLTAIYRKRTIQHV